MYGGAVTRSQSRRPTRKAPRSQELPTRVRRGKDEVSEEELSDYEAASSGSDVEVPVNDLEYMRATASASSSSREALAEQAALAEEAAPQRKKRRLRPGTKALRDIRRQQKGVEILMSKVAIRDHLIKAVMEHGGKYMRIQKGAFVAAAEVVQMKMIKIFEDANMMALNCRRRGLKGDDVRLAIYIQNQADDSRSKQDGGARRRRLRRPLSLAEKRKARYITNAKELNKPSIRRMALRAGVKRFSKSEEVYHHMREYATQIWDALAKDAVTYAVYNKRKTVMTRDIVQSAKQFTKLYGYSGN